MRCTGHHVFSIVSKLPFLSTSNRLDWPHLLWLSSHPLASPSHHYNLDASLHFQGPAPLSVSASPSATAAAPCQDPPLHVLDGFIISHCRRNTSRISMFFAQQCSRCSDRKMASRIQWQCHRFSMGARNEGFHERLLAGVTVATVRCGR